jgi:alpha-1,2-mannosyltransferase
MPQAPRLDRLDRLAASRFVRTLLLAAALVAVYAQAHTFFLAESHEVDSYSYWFAARAIERHANPYDLAVLRDLARGEELRLVASDARPPEVYPYVYPPPLAGVWRALLPLHPTTVHRLLEVLGTLALGAALLGMERAIAARRHGALLFAAFAVTLAVNGPAVSSTRLGQVNAPILASVALALVLLRRGRDTASALLLAVPTLIKLTPGLVWLGFGGPVEPRGRRYGLRLACALAACVLLMLPLAPPVHWAQYVNSLRTGLPWRSAYSLWGWLSMLAERAPAFGPWRGPLYLAAAVAALACAWRHQRRTPVEERPLEGAASALALGLLLSPLTWQHHFLFFMLPAWVWLASAWAERRSLLALAFAVLAVVTLLRLPGSLLVVRPIATAIALALATLAPRGARWPQ